MPLTQRQIELLDALVSQASHSTAGIDALRFRASYEDDLESLDDLERRHFLERTDKNFYAIRIQSLVAVRDRNSRAEKSLFLAGRLFDYLRRAYKTEPGQRILLTDLARFTDLPIQDVRRGVFYLAQASIWANKSTDVNAPDAYITPSEGILRYKTFNDLVAELQRWTEPPREPQSAREKQQKFGILDSPTLLSSDLQQPSGVLGTALVYLDLDHFKDINTDLTEAVVDEVVLPPVHRLLAAHAERLGYAYAEGGDEFVFLLPSFSQEMAIAFAESLRQHIADLRLGGAAATTRLSASLGVAHAKPGEDAESLKKRANEAKRFAKGHGRNTVAMWLASGPQLAAFQNSLSTTGNAGGSLPSEAPRDPERDLVRGVAKTVLKRERSPENTRLLLAKLRAEGTEIRNHPYNVDHMTTKDLDGWIDSINQWAMEAIEALKLVSVADAEWLATLRNVPEPSVQVPNIRLGGSSDRARYVKAFSEHDCRLERFEGLCKKHGVGA